MFYKVKPFKGIHYNLKKISDLSDVIIPPYDVIHPQMQNEFYHRSEYNFVRVDLAVENGDERYEASKKTYLEWIQNQILVQDEKPAFYFHHQTFILPNGQQITRKGFFGARRVEDFSEGGIKPHEKTLEGPKLDRLKLTRAVKANLSPVFSLYSDPGKEIDGLVDNFKKSPPSVEFKTREGELHRVWRIDDETVCQKIGEKLQNNPLFIADGHHRYETALNYRNERRQENPPGDGVEAFNSLLMYFSNLNDDGLVILPIHRALHNMSGFQMSDLLEKLKSHFIVKELGATPQEDLVKAVEEAGASNHAFGIISPDASQSYLISIDVNTWKKSSIAQTVPGSLRELDVTVLHRLILEEILKISPEAQAKQENIIYWKDTQRAIDETRSGKCQVTFLMNATRIEDMEKVAMAGEKMPQKSTFFYPKILSGIVVYSVE